MTWWRTYLDRMLRPAQVRERIESYLSAAAGGPPAVLKTPDPPAGKPAGDPPATQQKPPPTPRTG